VFLASKIIFCNYISDSGLIRERLASSEQKQKRNATAELDLSPASKVSRPGPSSSSAAVPSAFASGGDGGGLCETCGSSISRGKCVCPLFGMSSGY